VPKRVKKPEGRKRDSTLVLFVALNMILFAFFILLVALSQPNKTKEEELSMQVKKAFQSFGGTFLGLGTFIEQTGVSHDPSLESSEQLERFLGELSRFVEENRERKVLSYEIVAEGLLIHVSDDFGFDPGSAELREEVRPLYDAIHSLILRTTNSVRIEGHTDNVPMRSALIRDNWELSARRAMRVFQYFTAKGEIPESRLAVVGHGDTRPLASNLTAAGRAKNRRVTIVFLGKLRRVVEQ
jgi:chemotaxis protein MotB